MSQALPISTQAPGMARDIVRGYPRGMSPEKLGDALLVVSELVQNVVRHSGLSAPDELTFEIKGDSDLIRIVVDDRGSGFSRDELLPPSEDPWSGRGLVVVNAIASRWGAERSPEGGTHAWAEIDI